jgi:hypothetical protein
MCLTQRLSKSVIKVVGCGWPKLFESYAPMKSSVRRTAFLILAAALAGFTSSAKAATYTLNADLSDGGTISGSIIYDVYGYLADGTPGGSPPYSFLVNGGPLAGLNFSAANNGNGLGPTWGPNTVFDLYPNGTYGPELQLSFLGDLLTGPATLLTGLNGPSFICNAGYLCGGGVATYLTSGSVTVTPLPSTWTMLIAGFVGLGLFAYRGTRKSPSFNAGA